MRLPVIRDTDHVWVSSNSKTGVSINLPIEGTCRPTRVCHDLCYAKRGPISFRNAVARQRDNLAVVRRLAEAPAPTLRAEADRIASACAVIKRDWLRWNGSGDLVPGSVRLINELSARHPNIAQWIITRKPDEASSIKDRPSIRLTLSVDKSTPTKTASAMRALAKQFRKAIVRFSWLRTDEADRPPPFIDVVFNRHVGANFYPWQDERVCQASLPGTHHEDACNTCRRCFTDNEE